MAAERWTARAASMADEAGETALAAALRRAGDDSASRRLLLHDSRVRRILTRILRDSPALDLSGPPTLSVGERAEALRRHGLGPAVDQLRATWLAVAAGPDPTVAAVADAVLAAHPEPGDAPATRSPAASDADDGGWSRR